MASVTLQDVLGGPNLCGVIQGTTTGVANAFPPGFYQVDKTVDRDTGQYTRVTGTRTVARMAAYGSPSQQRNLKGVEAVPVKLIHAVESILLPTADYMNLLNYDDGSAQQRGIQEVTRQVRSFRANFDNLRVAALTSMLFQGAIYSDGHGNLLPNATGAKTSVTFNVPAGNRGQLDALGTGDLIITTSWDDASANIDAQLLNLRQVATRLSGYPLRCAFYGKNVPSYLTNNTKLQNYFIRSAGDDASYLSSAEVPSPLLGFTVAAGVRRVLRGRQRRPATAGGRQPGRLHARPDARLDRLAGGHVPRADQRRHGQRRRRPGPARQRDDRRRPVRVRGAEHRPRHGEDGRRRHVPAGPEGAAGDLHRDGDVLIDRRSSAHMPSPAVTAGVRHPTRVGPDAGRLALVAASDARMIVVEKRGNLGTCNYCRPRNPSQGDWHGAG